MKIAILYDLWEGTEEYPGAHADEELAKSGRARKPPRRPKLDREEIFEALTKLGHEPSYLEIDGTDSTLVAVARSKSDLIFNLTESYAGDDTKDMNIAAFLELIHKPYTGSSPRALHLAQDKVLAKKIFQFHGIDTPFFATSYRGELDHAHDLNFPLIVKPSSEDGSKGIDVGAVVKSVKELMERIHYIQEEFDSPALIEEYIDGREIYAAILGNGRPEALPLVELDLSQLPEGTPHIAGFEVKFEKEHEAYKKTRSRLADTLDDETGARIQEVALQAYKALKLRDYARIDLRLTSAGRICVIEANPNPWLSRAAEFSMAARGSGRTYSQTIGEIVSLAASRGPRG